MVGIQLNGPGFMRITNNLGGNYIALQSNKPRFGVWDTTANGGNGDWANLIATDVFVSGQSVCRQDGTNCPAVSGTVVGGGFEAGSNPCQYLWGVASCVLSYSSMVVACPSGTTKRLTGSVIPFGTAFWGYICVRD